MPEPYEQLVKEYLEIENYATRIDTKLSDQGDIDIIAYRAQPAPRTIVAEVKSGTWSGPKSLEEIKAKFDRTKTKLDELGITDPHFVLYCWPMAPLLRVTANERAQRLGFEIVTFDQILKKMLQFIADHLKQQWIYEHDCPNLMLLQLIGNCLKHKYLTDDDFLQATTSRAHIPG